MDPKNLKEMADNMVNMTESWAETIGVSLNEVVKDIPEEEYANVKNAKDFETLDKHTKEMDRLMKQMRKMHKDLRF